MSDKASCANCETRLHGPYCANCGQKASDLHRPFWWILGEFLDSVFSYDSRTFRTIWLLFSDPGEFTRLYNSGKRASMLPPFRTFLVATIVFFLALQITGVAMVRIEPKLVSLKGLDATARAELEKQLKREGQGQVIVGDSVGSIDIDMFVPAPPGGFHKELTADQKSRLQSMRVEINGEVERGGESAPPSWIAGLAQRATSGVEHAVADPIKFNSAMNIWLPRMMLVLVPVFAVLLALVHWRPRAFYIEHLIFSLHIHTVAFVGLSLVVVIVAFFQGNGMAWAIAPILALYLYMAMLRVYQRGPIWTGLKFLALSCVYGLILTVSLAIVFLLALAEV